MMYSTTEIITKTLESLDIDTVVTYDHARQPIITFHTDNGKSEWVIYTMDVEAFDYDMHSDASVVFDVTRNESTVFIGNDKYIGAFILAMQSILK